MTNRTENHIETFIEDINKSWQLSLTEQGLLESVFNLILAGKTKEIESVQHLLNDDIEELLENLDSYDLTRYAERHLGMLHETDIEEEKKLEDFSSFEIEREYNLRELGEEDVEEYDIVTQSQIDELVSNFLSADFEERNKMLKIK